MVAAPATAHGAVPLLVVSDVAARLERRGLLAPGEAARAGWRRVRLLVYARGPVVCERPAGPWLVDVALPAPAPRAR